MNKGFFNHNYQKTIYVYGLAFFLLTVNLIVPIQVDKQNVQWSPAQTIPGYGLDDLPPVLIADQNRTVHAFTSEWLSLNGDSSVKGVVYSRWSVEGGWTNPIDILLSPVKEARVTDAFLDKDGFIHVVFFGGDYVDGNIYYSKAPLDDASNARSWSAPIIVGESAGDPESAVFAEDEQGSLYVIFSGRQYGNGVYIVNSKDGGETWSKSTPIFLTDSDAPVVYLIHVIHSKSGWLHVIWNVYSSAGQGRGIYYSRSEDGDKWSDPSLLVYAQNGLGTQTPTIIEYQNTLLAIYNLPPKITMRRSADNGETWQDPVIVFPRHVGVNGTLSPVIDSNDVLHLFFGQRIPGAGSPDIHGMWHSIWADDRWTEPTAVIKGPRIATKEGLNSFDPYDAHAVVSQGNVILVTWRTDPGDVKNNGVWFSYAVLNAPELPVATSLPPADVNVTASPIPTFALVDANPITFDKDRQGQNVLGWIVVAVVIVIVLRLFYILFNRNN